MSSTSKDINEVLVTLSVQCNGEFSKLYEAIKNKTNVTESEIDSTISNLNSRYVTIVSSNYPKMLERYKTSPIVLYYHGNLKLLENQNIIAIIGKRKNSKYGEDITRKIVKELKGKNITIISGMASGIDSIALDEALKNNIPVIAILGSGINNIYPIENKGLYERIKEKGLILSEYPDNTKPKPEYFLIRNRIIAMIAKKILVCEADYKSGTMNTVCNGLDNGKDIYAIPYPYDSHSGCNLLIKEGAKLVECAADILD